MSVDPRWAGQDAPPPTPPPNHGAWTCHGPGDNSITCPISGCSGMLLSVEDTTFWGARWKTCLKQEEIVLPLGLMTVSGIRINVSPFKS